MKIISLKWKDFKINKEVSTPKIQALMKSFIGVTEDYTFNVICEDNLSDDEILAVNNYWNAISYHDDEATTFKTREQLNYDAENARQAALSTGTAKLNAIGLNQDEINALLGK